MSSGLAASTARTITASALRESPSAKGKLVVKLAQDTFMAVLSESGVYLKVDTGDNVGYVLRSALKITPGSKERPAFYKSIKGAGILPWSRARRFLRGRAVTIIDAKTGLSFRARNYVGTNHADMETLTKADTGKMKRIFGGKFSWQRRGVIVVSGDKRCVASMNGMPHGSQQFIKNNGLNGVFCLHFIGSKTHIENAVDLSHQSAIMYAYRAAN